MNVAIVGSRDWKYIDLVRAAVKSLDKDDVVISGGARGVDTIAENFAKKRGLEVLIFEADWDRHGKAAGYIRNKEIVKAADRIIAFQLDESKGTQHTIDLARKAGKPVKLTSYSREKGLRISG